MTSTAGAVIGVAVGLVAGSGTPLLARRLAGVSVPRWRWLAAGVLAGAVVGWRIAPAAAVVGLVWLLVVAITPPLAAIDLRAFRLPDPVVLPVLAIVAVLAAAAGETRALLAGALLLAGGAVLAVLPRAGFGFGDVKLAGVLGVALGLLSWAAVAWGMVLAVTIGGVVALVLLVTGRARPDTALPFGPCLLLGALLAAVPAGY